MDNTNNTRTENQPNWVLLSLAQRFQRHWLLFLATIVFAMGIAWLYIHYTLPLYESTGSILIKDEKKGTDDSKLLESLDLLESNKIIENEIEILHSRTLIKNVVNNLALYAPVKENRRIIQYPAYTSSPVLVREENPDSLREFIRVPFSYDSTTQSVSIGDETYPLNQWRPSRYGNIMFVANPAYERPAKSYPLYFSLINEKTVVNDVLERLEVNSPDKASTVISITIKDAIPQRGDDIINELLRQYEKADIEAKNRIASNTLTFLNNRLKSLVTDLDSTEHGIQEYKTKEGIVDIDEQGKLYLNAIGTNDQKASLTDISLAGLDNIEKYIASGNDDAGISPASFGIDDPVLTQSLEKLYNLETEYEKLKKTTAENNPILISIRNQISEVRPNILASVENHKKTLLAGKTNLDSTDNHYASMLQAIPAKERALVEISRQQGIKNGLYSFLLQKREEAALSYNSTISDSRIIDQAQSADLPVSPKKSLVYLLAVIAAVPVCFTILSLKEGLFQTILTRSDIKHCTATPIMGEITHARKTTPIVINNEKTTFIAEQFRQLRSAVLYTGFNEKQRRILVTSSTTGEGKSFIASNLALSLSLGGNKVALLELDLRSPKLGSILDKEEHTGATQYLTGEKGIDAIIQKTKLNENLFFIPAGGIPPNPSELLLNRRMPELLNRLETTFDYIIIDSPPIIPVTDAYIISPLCDLCMFIVRQEHTSKEQLKPLDENARLKGLENLYIVFNDVRTSNEKRYDYGYIPKKTKNQNR